MVGKRISQELLNLQHRQTLAMVGDEAMTSQKCIYCFQQLKKATRSIYDDNGVLVKSKPSRGTFICTNHHCHASTMSRNLMSSELIGVESDASSIGYPLPSLARKTKPEPYQN